MTTSRTANCGRPSPITADDLLDALDRMGSEVDELRARLEQLRSSRTCSRCRGELSEQVVTCPPRRAVRLFLTVDRLSTWARTLWP